MRTCGRLAPGLVPLAVAGAAAGILNPIVSTVLLVPPPCAAG
ncbi:hypothetical protein [Kitasatospora herbaricolor]|uniref:Uncharacterized protein n=1 Tax=Kitasatospora herbaricolor TaxID=68217 RepID=A0ABZ1WLU0_9ACTN|nr:hypothetical protein [Kitasatospora herbaricolor]